MSAVQDIIDLYGKGGIEVTTYAGTEETNAGQQPLIRTVIQPNANLITWVHPGIESQAALQRHHATIQSHLKAIKNLRRLLKNGGWVVSTASVLLLNAITWDWQFVWQSQIIRLLLSAAALFLFRYLFRVLILFVFRRYIRAKLQKYISL